MRYAYYNEFDEQAAQWLRNLIAAGLIPDGEVDERSITDVHPADLIGYGQCHFFAGIGGWALAARIAGWPDDRQLWSGSTPCQPFSVAGKQRGVDDARHLWPDQFRLIRAHRPDVWLGEQVAAAAGKNWLDGVLADLEGISYVGGAVIVPACAVNAPHRRDRLYLVASRDGVLGDGERARLEGLSGHEHGTAGRQIAYRSAAAPGCGSYGDVADDESAPHRVAVAVAGSVERPQHEFGESNLLGDVADRHSGALEQGRAIARRRDQGGDADLRSGSRRNGGVWDNAEWIIGHDGKVRRVEPGVRLLVDGISPWVAGMRTSSKTASRQVALKGFGNAIVPELAAEVIAAWMEVAP